MMRVFSSYQKLTHSDIFLNNHVWKHKLFQKKSYTAEDIWHVVEQEQENTVEVEILARLNFS